MATKLWLRALHLGLVPVFAVGLPSLIAPSACAQKALITQAQSVTDADQNQVMRVTVWLNMHNRAQLDAKVSKLYDETSTTYRKWLKPADLAVYTPTDAEVKTLKAELLKQGLTVKATGPHNMFVSVTGTVSALQTAFHTQVKKLMVNGQAVSATTDEPKMTGAAASMVSAVSGMTSRKFHPNVAHPIDPNTGKRFAGIPLAQPNGLQYASDCFVGVQAETFTTPGAALPVAEYVGNRYGSNVTNTKPGTIAPCGYDVAEVTTAYGMPAAYKKGLDGTGQTIVIVDAFGSPTIANDANVFSSLNGLPALTSSNFQVVYPFGTPEPTTVANASGWALETSLDVEWAHAMAPGANIVLVVSPSDGDTDFAGTLLYPILGQFGSVISNSYSGDEADDIISDPDELVISNLVTEIGAALGISVNFSSGDDGDLEAVVGVKTVSDLAASPYATSVGGTSLALTKKNAIKFQTGWGNNFTKLASSTGAPQSPPLLEGNVGGSGGGESVYFPKPIWQQRPPGTGRQQPDISYVADPYTGAELVFTDAGVQQLEVIGGTSLSCPMFSGMWAIANQRAVQRYGTGALLGQAAPIVAQLAGTTAITDVTPYTSPTNVAGLLFQKNGVTVFTPEKLSAPLEGTDEFLSALYNSPFSGSWFDISFGTDTSLKVTRGWDNVTGYGTPNGLDFINAASK